jgi:hypothetical protein
LLVLIDRHCAKAIVSGKPLDEAGIEALMLHDLEVEIPPQHFIEVFPREIAEVQMVIKYPCALLFVVIRHVQHDTHIIEVGMAQLF